MVDYNAQNHDFELLLLVFIYLEDLLHVYDFLPLHSTANSLFERYFQSIHLYDRFFDKNHVKYHLRYCMKEKYVR